MSDLKVALIILGAFIIAGVVVYNWMQERKLRKEVTSEFIVPQKDVLGDDFHIDTDAYIIDKELAEVTEKAKHHEHHTIPAETLREAPSEAVREAVKNISAAKSAEADFEISDELVKNDEIVEPIQLTVEEQNESPQKLPELSQPELIVQAYLHEKTQALQVNLP